MLMIPNTNACDLLSFLQNNRGQHGVRTTNAPGHVEGVHRADDDSAPVPSVHPPLKYKPDSVIPTHVPQELLTEVTLLYVTTCVVVSVTTLAIFVFMFNVQYSNLAV